MSTALSFKSFVHLLSGSAVKWFTDNQAVPLIVESGSMKEHLHQLAVDIFYTAREIISRLMCSGYLFCLLRGLIL